MGIEASPVGSPAVPRSRSALLGLALAVLASACSETPSGPPSGFTIEIASGDGQKAQAGSAVAVSPTVSVVDPTGNGVEGVDVSFTVVSGGGWVETGTVTSDASGAASVWWLLGPDPAVPQQLRAQAGTATAEFVATATAPVPGVTRVGRQSYMEYIPGDLPVIISAPHGGSLTPAEIPDRTNGTTVRDTNTEELVRAIRDAFISRTGRAPHVIIDRLHRIKLDANREIVEAAQGNIFAERAWFEWHAFIEAARIAAGKSGPGGQALYLDVHGQSHPVLRIEIGYLLGAGDLALGDAALGQASIIARSSIRALAGNDGARFVELVRGSTSFGQLLEDAGYPAVPSATQPDPGNDPYFTGGYNTQRHGSRDGGNVHGMQLELNFAGIRDTDDNRRRFAAAFTGIVSSWFNAHMGAPSIEQAPGEPVAGGLSNPESRSPILAEWLTGRPAITPRQVQEAR